MYLPLTQHPVSRMVLLLRSTGDPLELVSPVKDVVRALDPDIVALQEASAGWGRGNVAARVAADLGFHYVFAPATPRVLPVLGRLATWVMNFSEGSAVLSRFPIARYEVTDLPRCVKFLDPRIMLQAEVDAPWGRVGIVSAHTARADCQLERIVDVVQAWPADRPAVVMGDFNTGEAAPGLGVFSRAGMIDAFRAANPDGDGATTWQNVVGPARTARRRVDYVFLRSANGRQWRVVASRPGWHSVLLFAPDLYWPRRLALFGGWGLMVFALLFSNRTLSVFAPV